jgi:subtilase family serine protease
MTKVTPRAVLRGQCHRRWRAVVALSVTAVLGAACGTGAVRHSSSGSSAHASSDSSASRQQPSPQQPSPQQPGSAAGCASVTTCYGPQQIEAAYGIAPLLHRGIDGRGQTVVLPELAEPQFPLPTSDIRQDLARFDKLFGLPAATLRANASLVPSASPWLANGEEVLDAEMIHAVAPGATISVVLVAADSLDNPASAMRAAVAAIGLGSSLGDVISISAAGQTGGEHCDTRGEVAALHGALQTAARHRVTVVAASGDIGAVGEPCHVISGLIGGSFAPVKEVNLPAADPLVLGAGGTTLTASHQSGAYVSESAWDLPDPGSQFQGSGGGFSRQLSRPAYQHAVPGIGAHRGVPDVAAEAAPDIAVVTATGANGYTIDGHGGTSASAPLWAGLIALADQAARRPLGFVNAGIYRIAESSSYHAAFHDITTGLNTATFPRTPINGYATSAGWDAVTGWGSPDASVLIPLLTSDVRDGDANGP